MSILLLSEKEGPGRVMGPAVGLVEAVVKVQIL